MSQHSLMSTGSNAMSNYSGSQVTVAQIGAGARGKPEFGPVSMAHRQGSVNSESPYLATHQVSVGSTGQNGSSLLPPGSAQQTQTSKRMI